MTVTTLAQASSYATSIDGLILLIGWIVGVWFVIAEAIFFYLIFRYRHRDGHKGEYITGEEKHQKRWITIPHGLVLICDVFIIVGAVRVWYEIKQDLPTPDAEVRIIGQQWAWSFVQPGLDGQLDTPDDIRTVASAGGRSCLISYQTRTAPTMMKMSQTSTSACGIVIQRF